MRVLETYEGFGNLWRFWKPMGVLETYGGSGNLWGRFLKRRSNFQNLDLKNCTE